MPCNYCLPSPPPIFDIPPPPDPSLILHLLIDDLEEKDILSNNNQKQKYIYKYSTNCSFNLFFNKLNNWLLPLLAIFLFCICTTIIIGLTIFIRKKRKRLTTTTTKYKNNLKKEKKNNQKRSNSFILSSSSNNNIKIFNQIPESIINSSSSSPLNSSSSSSSAFSSSPKQFINFPSSSTETITSNINNLINIKQQILPKKTNKLILNSSNTFSLKPYFQQNNNTRCKLPKKHFSSNNPVSSNIFSSIKNNCRTVSFQFNNNNINSFDSQFISWKKEKINKNINNNFYNGCGSSGEIYEELPLDYDDIAEPPYIKRLNNNKLILLPPPISQPPPPPLPPEHFNNNNLNNNNEKEEKQLKTESGYGTGKSRREGKEEKIIKKLNKNLSPPPPINIWTSLSKEEENSSNEYICHQQQQRTYV